MEYLNADGIKKVFAARLMQYRGYSEEEAEIAVSDFPDRVPYVVSESAGECEIDGEEYIQENSHTMLWLMGIHDVPDLNFSTYYRKADIPNGTGGEYAAAKKLYLLVDPDSGG